MPHSLERELGRFIEERWGSEVANEVEERKLSLEARGSDGDQVVLTLVVLASATMRTLNDVLLSFGEFLFERLVVEREGWFVGHASTIEFLRANGDELTEGTESLCAGLTTPKTRIDVVPLLGFTDVVFTNPRALWKVPQGLLGAAIDYFGAGEALEVRDLSNGAGIVVRFRIVSRLAQRRR